jgi:hypothetical protein
VWEKVALGEVSGGKGGTRRKIIVEKMALVEVSCGKSGTRRG